MTLTIEGYAVFISRNVAGLARALTAHEGHREGQSIVWKPTNLLTAKDGGVCAPPTLLHRIKKFLLKKNITYRTVWKTKPFHQFMGVAIHDVIKVGYTARQRRVLKAVLQQPAAALCRASEEDWQWLLVEVLRVFRAARAIIVVETENRLNALHDFLRHHLTDKIGLLAGSVGGSQFGQQRITIAFPTDLTQGIISPGECEILVFDRCPPTGFLQLERALYQYVNSWRMARLGDERRGRARMLMAESCFGAIQDVSKTLSAGKTSD